MLNLKSPQLETFMALAATGKVSVVAENMQKSISTITKRIHGLEQALKAPLFTRVGKQLQLTPQGQLLLRYCNDMTNHEGALNAKFSTTEKDLLPMIKIVGPNSYLNDPISIKILSIFQKTKDICLSIKAESTVDRNTLLRNGLCHFAVIQPQYVIDGMTTLNLTPHDYILVAPKAWQQRELIDILENEAIIDYHENDEIHAYDYLSHFNLSQHRSHTRHFVNNETSMLQLVREQLGYCILTLSSWRQHDCSQLFMLNEGKVMPRMFCLAWYDKDFDDEYYRLIIDALSE